MNSRYRNMLSFLAISAMIAACARTRTGDISTSCAEPPAIPLVPFSSALAQRLSGDYSFTAIAKSGPRRGKAAHGVLHLVSADTLQRCYVHVFKGPTRRIGEQPLVGWTDLAGDIGMSTGGVPLDSRDSTNPGVASRLDSLRSGLRFMLGFRPILDGGGNEFVVTRVSVDEFAGHWSSQMGYTTDRADGYFCAVRMTARD